MDAPPPGCPGESGQAKRQRLNADSSASGCESEEEDSQATQPGRMTPPPPIISPEKQAAIDALAALTPSPPRGPSATCSPIEPSAGVSDDEGSGCVETGHRATPDKAAHESAKASGSTPMDTDSCDAAGPVNAGGGYSAIWRAGTAGAHLSRAMDEDIDVPGMCLVCSLCERLPGLLPAPADMARQRLYIGQLLKLTLRETKSESPTEIPEEALLAWACQVNAFVGVNRKDEREGTNQVLYEWRRTLREYMGLQESSESEGEPDAAAFASLY